MSSETRKLFFLDVYNNFMHYLDYIKKSPYVIADADFKQLQTHRLEQENYI